MSLILGLIYAAVGLSIVWKILSDEMRGRVPLACARNAFLVGLAPRLFNPCFSSLAGLLLVASFISTNAGCTGDNSGALVCNNTVSCSGGDEATSKGVNENGAGADKAGRVQGGTSSDAEGGYRDDSSWCPIDGGGDRKDEENNRDGKFGTEFYQPSPEIGGGDTPTQERSRTSESGKPIFDGTHFVRSIGRRNTLVPIQVPGTSSLRMIYGFKVGLHRNKDRVERSSVRSRLASMQGEPSMVVLDIEHLPVETVRRHPGASDAEVQQAHDTLRMVINEIKRRWPLAEVGLFDMLPPQHMHAWDPQHPKYDRYMAALERGEVRIDPITGKRDESSGLLDAVDFLTPAFYLHERRVELYHRDKASGRPMSQNRGIRKIKDWITETTAAAQTIGKPVYPFVWHRIHGGWKPDEDGFDTAEYVGDELYRLVLETSLDHADGVILWSRKEKYDEDHPWQAVLREVLEQ